jgi:hypothetical protein
MGGNRMCIMTMEEPGTKVGSCASRIRARLRRKGSAGEEELQREVGGDLCRSSVMKRCDQLQIHAWYMMCVIDVELSGQDVSAVRRVLQGDCAI